MKIADEEYCLIGCTLCWRSGCSSWVALEPEVEEADHAESVADSPTPTDAGDTEDIDLSFLGD